MNKKEYRRKKIISSIFICLTIIICTSCAKKTVTGNNNITNSEFAGKTPVIMREQITPPTLLASPAQHTLDYTITTSTAPTKETPTTEPTLTPTPDVTPYIHTHDYQIKDNIRQSCETDGYITYKCECGDEYKDIIPKTGHNYNLTDKKEPTILSEGYNQYSCLTCNMTYKEILPTVHSIADDDMCGESLVEKPLKHAPIYSTIEKYFDLYHTHPTFDDEEHGFISSVPFSEIYNTFYYNGYKYMYYTIELYTPADENYCYVIYNKEKAVLQEKAYEAATKILKELQIDNTISQKEAIIRINNYICETKYYDYSMVGINRTTPRFNNLYDSFISQNGVCSDYAFAFQILCLSAGIECHWYESKPMNHAWNKVIFSDGSYLWVDTTWNDLGADGSTRTKYLLITDEELWKTHRP